MKPIALVVALGLVTVAAHAQQDSESLRAQSLFRVKCAACHSMACNRNGPKLEGVIGRQAGVVADYRYYTAELKGSGVIWSEKTLDEYIADPGKMIPGTSMTAAGRVDSATERRDIIAHVLRQDRSGDLCL